jgi:predicted Zn-dependent protease with MMP-like domain
MTVQEIPLTSAPQTFQILLGSNYFKLAFQWRDPSPGWVLDIVDSTGNPIVQGIPLVTGVDLLEQFQYLGIGGQLRVQTDTLPDAVPTFANLGVNSHLYFVSFP